MTAIDHPLTETRVEKLWNAHVPLVINLQVWTWGDRTGIIAALRAAYDAGRDDALKPLDPVADLTPGTTIRDVCIRWWGEFGAAFISVDADGPCVATARGLCALPTLNAFTTEDRKTRYTREGDTWTAETLKETRND